MKFNRRHFLMTSVATVTAASVAAPAFAADPIVILCQRRKPDRSGLPIRQIG